MIVTVIGSSGLVGGALVEVLINSDSITRINLIVRKASERHHPKIKEIMVDFNDLVAYEANFPNSEALFCCIGTTMKNVKGYKELYKSIDYGIPLKSAKIALNRGYKSYLLVSALGANASSSVFYNRLKGEVENDLIQLGFEATHIFRPSFLLGNRKENRIGELIGKNIFKAISFLLPAKYRAIYDVQVAKAMLKKSLSDLRGSHIWYYKDMI